MRGSVRRSRVGRCDRRLQIVQATGRIVARDMLAVDGAIHLLIHLEELMDGVARIGVIRHRRTGHREGAGRRGGDIGDARVGAECRGKTRAAGAKQELRLRWQPRIAAWNEENAGAWWVLDAADIRRRQNSIERLVLEIYADKILAAIGRRRDLKLMGLGEIFPRRPIGVDNAFGQQVQYSLVPVFRQIGGVEVIEAAILPDNDEDVLDRRGGADLVDRLVWTGRERAGAT